jgi:hypothetical protein
MATTVKSLTITHPRCLHRRGELTAPAWCTSPPSQPGLPTSTGGRVERDTNISKVASAGHAWTSPGAVEWNSSPVSANNAARIAARIIRQDAVGPKKNAQGQPRPWASVTHHPLPSDPRRQQRYIGLCPNKSVAPALPSFTALTANSVSLQHLSHTSISSRRGRGQCRANVRTARMIPANFTGGLHELSPLHG